MFNPLSSTLLVNCTRAGPCATALGTGKGNGKNLGSRSQTGQSRALALFPETWCPEEPGFHPLREVLFSHREVLAHL